MSRHFWRFFLFCSLVVHGQWVFAQQPQLPSIHYNANNGLPSSEAHAVFQDRKGHIWIATDNGVSRFNGYEFQNFGPEQGLLDNVVFSFFEDAQGKIWMSSLSGNFYYHHQDSIMAFPYNHIIQKHNNTSFFTKEFFITDNGTFYSIVNGIGVIKIDVNGQYELITPNGYCGIKYIFQHQDNVFNIRIICPENKNKAPSIDSDVQFVLHLDQGKGHQEIALTGDSTFKISNFGEAIYIHPNKMVFTNGTQIYCVNDKQIEKQIQIGKAISSMQLMENGNICVGLKSYDGEGGVLTYNSYEELLQHKFVHTLKPYTISDILEDQAGGRWFTTTENGVFYVPNPNAKVYNQKSGFSDNYISSISVKDEQGIFIGLKNGSVYELNHVYQQLKDISPKQGEVMDLKYIPQKQQLWLGAFSTLYRDEQTWKEIHKKTNQLISSNKFFLHSSNDFIWTCLGGNSGFSKINTIRKKIDFFTGLRSPLRQRTFSVFQDFSGRIWLGVANGLHEFKNDQLIPTDIPHPVLKLRIEDITQLADSTLIFGTKGGGILCWKKDWLLQIKKSDGLTADMIEKIHIDAKQQIWVGTLNGLNQIQLKSDGSFKINTFTTADGLPSNEITDIDSQGNSIWIATPHGLAQLPTDSIDLTAPTPIIDQVKVNEQTLKKNTSTDWSHWQSNIRINFYAIDYRQGGKIRYRYRLRLSDAWAYTQLPSISYAALSPASYRFEIQAASKNGKWSPSTFFAFRIAPPFWQTYWFYTLCILIISALLYTIYRYRIRQIKNKADLEMRIQKSQYAALRAQLNPHFIFNCLNSIQGFVSNNSPMASRYLSHFSRLTRAVLDATRKTSIALEDEVQLLEDYIELEKMRMEYPFEYAIKLDPKLDPFDTMIPPMLIQPLIENAIVHGLSKLDKKGYLEICYQYIDEQFIEVIVRDNGVGIQRSSHTSKSLHTSLGLGIIREQLAIQNGKNHAQHNPLKVESLAGQKDWEQGTQVRLLVAYS